MHTLVSPLLAVCLTVYSAVCDAALSGLGGFGQYFFLSHTLTFVILPDTHLENRSRVS